MSKPFHQLPHKATVPLEPFTANIPDSVLEDLKRRIQDTPEIRDTYETLGRAERDGEDLGVKKDWVNEALELWTGKFDWRSFEKRINSFPNYKADIEHDGQYQVHFMGLFSEKEDAQPIIMTHGWPGSFLEFLPLIEYLSKKYTPQTLPIHLVVPSLIGYGYSSPPPIDKEFTTRDNAPIFNSLMEGLGFQGYIAQGGDVGSAVSRFLAEFDSCKAIHLNMWFVKPSEADKDISKFDKADQQALAILNDNRDWGFAYNHEHATKTSTIAIVVSSNPVSLLAWIGEKMLVWAHEETRPALDIILANVTLYWITKSYPTGLYHYRTTNGKSAIKRGANKPKKTSKPAGYSHFINELIPTPISWVKNSGDANLVWSKRHERGGHFAALEVPEDFWEDINEFVDKIKQSSRL